MSLHSYKTLGWDFKRVARIQDEVCTGIWDGAIRLLDKYVKSMKHVQNLLLCNIPVTIL